MPYCVTLQYDMHLSPQQHVICLQGFLCTFFETGIITVHCVAYEFTEAHFPELAQLRNVCLHLTAVHLVNVTAVPLLKKYGTETYFFFILFFCSFLILYHNIQYTTPFVIRTFSVDED